MIYIRRSSLTHVEAPHITILNEAAVIVFRDLTLTDPEGYSGSCNCDIVLAVQYTSLFPVIENQHVAIDVNVTYGSIQRLVRGYSNLAVLACWQAICICTLSY